MACIANAERTILPLDGRWQIAESVDADKTPATFDRTVAVPGLVKLAQPPFSGMEEIQSAAESKARTPAKTAEFQPLRNYFWYRTEFKWPHAKGASAHPQVAILKINKAQFGTAVWLNGRKIGEHLHCFTAGFFDLTPAMNWQGTNQLVVRIGAHRAVLPPSVVAGSDAEKHQWTPGIYDSVAVSFCDNPVIESVQIAPRIQSSDILVQTSVKNYGKPVAFDLNHTVSTWKDNRRVVGSRPVRIQLGEGEECVTTQVVSIPQARLWSPENPFLYVLETTTGGDDLRTRFGMREFRCDTPTRRFYLNGKMIYLRGSNITLHRFFEDPQCGALPWNETWVRGLLVDIPRRMRWNSFRFCIGPVPDRWLDIADETGLLIQNEYFIWAGQNWPADWAAAGLVREFSEWMRDNWNHPSVVIWDACNETRSDVLAHEVVPVVRRLDLSRRPWENGYNPPDDPDDPVENHPYENFHPERPFVLTDLETAVGAPLKMDGVRTPATAHALINNEYASLWLHRDGTPTGNTKPKYDRLLPNATPEERKEFYAYLLGGLTEYWRAHRQFAAVLHFVLLTCSYPGTVTSDHFVNVEKLELDPAFVDYVGEAFKPLGVYLRFWQSTLPAGTSRQFEILMVNDEYEAVSGELILALETTDGKTITEARRPFVVGALGGQTYCLMLRIPSYTGPALVKATAHYQREPTTTTSRRKVIVVEPPDSGQAGAGGRRQNP
ncbi:MAG: hypothetical protein N3D11_17325 [Candidatus Sumerlaeia bacterium]|nr:hypothetical protein [Candidatus Sumerlaeia bacterium]